MLPELSTIGLSILVNLISDYISKRLPKKQSNDFGTVYSKTIRTITEEYKGLKKEHFEEFLRNSSVVNEMIKSRNSGKEIDYPLLIREFQKILDKNKLKYKADIIIDDFFRTLNFKLKEEKDVIKYIVNSYSSYNLKKENNMLFSFHGKNSYNTGIVIQSLTMSSKDESSYSDLSKVNSDELAIYIGRKFTKIFFLGRLKIPVKYFKYLTFVSAALFIGFCFGTIGNPIFPREIITQNTEYFTSLAMGLGAFFAITLYVYYNLEDFKCPRCKSIFSYVTVNRKVIEKKRVDIAEDMLECKECGYKNIWQHPINNKRGGFL